MGTLHFLKPNFAGVIRPIKNAPKPLPFFVSMVPAGFPSPAEDYEEESLDLNDYLVTHPAATFFIRVKGDSMVGAGIYDGCLLIVDRSIQPYSGCVVIAFLNNEVTVKRFLKGDGYCILKPENPDYRPIEVLEGSELIIWGVVKHVIHEPK